MTEIADRTAFITGGANGIGLGIARSLARAGARLALVDLDADGLARAKAELDEVTEVFTAVLDVRDRTAYASVAADAEAQVGSVSILVNNAGVAGGAPAHKLSYDLWDWGMGINLDGVINGIQTFLPGMAARGAGGHIVNTASGAGLVARTGGVLYCTAKFAVVGMSEALALELPPQGIGVTVLCPGPVATDIVTRTQAAQPVTARRPLSAAQQARIEETSKYLAKGTSPNVVGDMVRDAIRKNQLYVHTDRLAMEMIMERSKALLDAMPPAA